MHRAPDLSHVKKILVIKLRHHGDVLLSSAVFSILKKYLPDASIDAYIYKETLPILEGHAAIDGFVLCDKAWKKLPLFSRLRRERGLLRKIAAKKYDLVINLTEGDRGAIACKASKASLRIGFDPEGSGMWQKKRCYSHIARICHAPRHSVEKNLDVLRCLGIFPSPEERKVSFPIPSAAKERVEAALASEGVIPGRYIAIHPVSRWLFKCWPTQNFAALISLLLKRGEKIVLTSSSDPFEMQIVEDIVAKVSSPSVCSLAGKISLKELGSVIEQSKLLITVDSLPLHISSALTSPVVALFGPTSEVNWAPWQNPYGRVVKTGISCRPCYMPGCGGSGKSDCLETLPVERVLEAVLSLLSESEPLSKVGSACSFTGEQIFHAPREGDSAFLD